MSQSQEIEYLAGIAIDPNNPCDNVSLRVYELKEEISGLVVPKCMAHLSGVTRGLIVAPGALEWAGAIEQTDEIIPESEGVVEIGNMFEPEIIECMEQFVERASPVEGSVINRRFARFIIGKCLSSPLSFILQSPSRIRSSSTEEDPTLHTGFYL